MRDWRRGKTIAAEQDQGSVNTFHIVELETDIAPRTLCTIPVRSEAGPHLAGQRTEG
jgi:hypothetical protein